MTPIKARPTIYKGTPMRSRLEATAAAQLDELGVLWVYEPMAFADEAGQYLPDFVLWAQSEVAYYLDVKPQSISMKGMADALDRMSIIRSSVPKAFLGVWLPEVNILFADVPEGGRHAVQATCVFATVQDRKSIQGTGADARRAIRQQRELRCTEIARVIDDFIAMADTAHERRELEELRNKRTPLDQATGWRP